MELHNKLKEILFYEDSSAFRALENLPDDLRNNYMNRVTNRVLSNLSNRQKKKVEDFHQAYSNQDGSNQDGSNQDGSNQDGSNQDGSNQDGSNQDGSNQGQEGSLSQSSMQQSNSSDKARQRLVRSLFASVGEDKGVQIKEVQDMKRLLEMGMSYTYQSQKILNVIDSFDLKFQGSGVQKQFVKGITGVSNTELSNVRAIGRKSSRLRKINMIKGRPCREFDNSEIKLTFVLDISASMQAADVCQGKDKVSRLDLGKAIIASVYKALNQRERDNVDMYTYDTSLQKVSISSLPHLQANGGTKISVLNETLISAPKEERFLIVTDGVVPDLSLLDGKRKIAILTLIDAPMVQDDRIVLWDELSIPKMRKQIRLLMK